VQRLVPLSPFAGMSDEAFATVFTGVLRALKASRRP
jgi:hypothetical protein